MNIKKFQVSVKFRNVAWAYKSATSMEKFNQYRKNL